MLYFYFAIAVVVNSNKWLLRPSLRRCQIGCAAVLLFLLPLASSAHQLSFLLTHALFLFPPLSLTFLVLSFGVSIRFGQFSTLTLCLVNNTTRLPCPAEQIPSSMQSLSMRLAHHLYNHVATCLRHTPRPSIFFCFFLAQTYSFN